MNRLLVGLLVIILAFGAVAFLRSGRENTSQPRVLMKRGKLRLERPVEAPPHASTRT